MYVLVFEPHDIAFESVKLPNVDCTMYSQPLLPLGAGETVIEMMLPTITEPPLEMEAPELLLTWTEKELPVLVFEPIYQKIVLIIIEK